jgi:multicomponent Na+:H+ antiporter subunit F
MNIGSNEQMLLLIGMVFLSGTIFFCLLRAILGPRLTDRVVAVNMIGVKTILLIVMVAIYIGEGYLLDVALVYALLSFLAVVVLTTFVMQFKQGKLRSRKNHKAEGKTDG